MLHKNQNIYVIIAKNIKKHRKIQGITQKELAIKCGYSYSYIRRIEAPNCIKNFSILTVYNISQALNTSISEIFEIDDI